MKILAAFKWMCWLPMVALVACQSTPVPSVTVQDVRVVEQTAEGARVDILLETHGDGEEDLKIEAIDYRLFVDGLDAFEITDLAATQAIDPEAFGARTMHLSASFETGGKDILGRAYDLTGRIHYRPPGAWHTALHQTGKPWPSVTFEQTARLNSGTRPRP